MDFFLSFWGIMLIIHFIGMIVFQPYLVRAVSRNTRQSCPKGNSDDFCKKYHPLDCKFGYGIQKSIDAGAFWGGTGLAFVWEITALFMLLWKNASKPDAIQTQYQTEKDKVSFDKLTEFQKNILEVNKRKELTAAKDTTIIYGEDSEVEVHEPEPLSLREVQMMVDREAKRSDDYGYRAPEWMKEERRLY